MTWERAGQDTWPSGRASLLVTLNEVKGTIPSMAPFAALRVTNPEQPSDVSRDRPAGPLDQPQDQHDNAHDEQEMDEKAGGLEHQPGDCPQNDQHDSERDQSPHRPPPA